MNLYTEPKQNRKGLWETTVVDDQGLTVAIVCKTTKKALTTWIKEQKAVEACPRCGSPKMDKVLVRNALSRKDNKTYICNDCGTAEAIEELMKSEAANQ